MNIRFSEEIRKAAPGLKALVITADIKNSPTPDTLWGEITTVAERVRTSYEMPMVNKHPAIAATRTAYKACGKEPNRYRPSQESLMRRMVKGMELYRSLSVIDLGNLLSVASGHSVGAFDADKLAGDTATLGVGREGEEYEGIGRGVLNIAGMPVWRDSEGGFGTPTSDHERTKIDENTSRLFMIVNMYDPYNVDEVEALAHRLLTTYADARNIQMTIHPCNC